MSKEGKVENNKLSGQNNNKWKIATIILIVLATVLAGTTTLFAIRSEQIKYELNDIKNENSKNENEGEDNIDEPCDDTSSTPDNRTYLTISEWGVRMEIPYGLENMTYTFKSDESAVITGKLNKGFARGDNVESDFASIDAVFITRSKESTISVAGMTESSDFKVGDYYYFIERTRDGKLPSMSAELVKEQTIALALSAAFTLALVP